jgi:hypothetical protein
MNPRTAVGAIILVALAALPLALHASEGQFAGDWQRTFAVGAADLATTGENPYLILRPGHRLTLEGREGGKLVRLVVTVLDETRLVGGIDTRVVEERESEDGALVEVSRNFMAIHRSTHDIYYLGEEVDIYKNGKIVDHEGAWMHGARGATLGLLLPASPVVGQRYYQEVAPGVAMDRAQVLSVSERMTTPAGTFDKCLKIEETTPLEPGKEYKLYAPGVGLVKDGALALVARSQTQASGAFDSAGPLPVS